MSIRSASTPPRFRLSWGQWALSAVLTLLLIALVTSLLTASSAQRKHTEVYARTESATTNMLYTTRETLTYVDSAERYVLGVSPRRNAQLARALLGQRLSVVGDKGVTAGDSLTPEYREALVALDGAIAQLPPGLLDPEKRDEAASVILPKAQALSGASRQMVDSTAAQLHDAARASDAALLRGRLLQLVLLVAAIAVAAVLLLWVGLKGARRYRSARAALDEEGRVLSATQNQLDRVSALERGQARVLERIATGAPAGGVVREIAQLASKISGGRSVRIVMDARTVAFPTGGDFSGTALWHSDFESGQAVTGTLDVFGDSEGFDDIARRGLQRCRDLVTLALDRDASARRLSHQASHDALTGLANRSLLLIRLSESLAESRHAEETVALLFCDLDRFKMVNDSIGHAGGDQLLIEAARRLSAIVRDTDTVARLGGDEFVVLCPALPDRAHAVALAERIRDALSAPYTVDAKEAFVGASIGIAFADDSTISGAELMREADVAMYRAKLTEGSHINVFDSHLEAEVAERLDLDAALRRALERDQLRLAAQPIVALDSGAVTGFELLLVWSRPGVPDLSPATFIPLAEDNGMIVDIGRWVLQEGIAQLAQWRRAGLAEGMTISINVSARQVREPGFVDEVLALLSAEDVPADALIIELTEHALIDLRVAHVALDQLRAAGVRISLDDFGTGYSSLTQLRSLPVDQMKLDRSFAAALDEGSDKQGAVVRSVVSLANALALDLVVEGVETVAEHDALVAMGARKGQGFLYHRPMEFDDAYELLRSGGHCTVPKTDKPT